MNKLGTLQDLSHTWANSKYENRELSDKISDCKDTLLI